MLACAVCLSGGGFVQISLADEDAEQLEEQVKSSAEAYNTAIMRQEELNAEIAELDERIAELEEKLPGQRERSDESIRALYKYEYDTSSVLMMMLESASITDMLAIVDSYNWIIEYNTSEIRNTIQMEAELEAARTSLASDKESVEQAANDALTSLQEAQAARERMAARAEAIQIAEQQALDSSSASEEEKQAASSASSSASASNVGWSADKSQFVNQWAPRIDSYLAGSPTAGTGTCYAAAAWDNGVDPRWAPAISYIESSKGAACFRSHNAWGYGSYGFGSWEEGINRIVSALGSPMYGGYLTREAAAIYCPPNADHWYNTCAEQMAMI